MCGNCKNILLKNSSSKNWKISRGEWSLIDENKIKNNCVCGKKIKNCFILFNKKTLKKQILGSSCIKTTFKDNKNMIHKTIYKYCEYCCKYIKRTNLKNHNKTITHLDRLYMFKEGQKLIYEDSLKSYKGYRFIEDDE